MVELRHHQGGQITSKDSRRTKTTSVRSVSRSSHAGSVSGRAHECCPSESPTSLIEYCSEPTEWLSHNASPSPAVVLTAFGRPSRVLATGVAIHHAPFYDTGAPLFMSRCTLTRCWADIALLRISSTLGHAHPRRSHRMGTALQNPLEPPSLVGKTSAIPLRYSRSPLFSPNDSALRTV